MSRRKGRPAKSMGRFVTIAGRATNVSLEDAFWQSPKEIASERDTTRDFYRQQIPVSKRPRTKG